LVIIAGVCTVLSILQYKWMGELSRAERARLRSGLNEQASLLAQAFDDEIRKTCSALLPHGAELRNGGLIGALTSRYQEWAASHDRNVFSRIGIAVPEAGHLQLRGIDHEGRITQMEWPRDWAILQSGMTARLERNGPPPSVPANSTVVEVPVFGGRSAGRTPPAEVGWIIFEISEDYVRDRILPRLVAEYIGSGTEAVYDLSVGWPMPRSAVVFSTRPDNTAVTAGADLTTGIFAIRGPAQPRRGRGRVGGEDSQSRWVLAVRHREGSLDVALSRARMRNLVTSLVLIGLLAGTAWALVRYTARSRRLMDMQFRFATGVSHDLRTPLTAIRGAAFNIADGVVTEPAATKRYADLILRNTAELTRMIENVLAFSASLHSRRVERRETFAVRDLLEHAVSAMAEEAQHAGCTIEIKVAPGLPALGGDRVALELAFRNLIGNAIRHAAEGKWVAILAERSGDGVVVRVCDRGPGIPEAEHERIFEPFYRGAHAQAGGTGLGLSLVKDTVERFGGKLAVRNSRNGGAEFTVRLPAIADGAA
jgi:signal transduction histidine kinase